MVDPKQLITVEIHENTAADHTIWTPPSGTRWVLWALYLTAQGAVDFYVKSGSTAISGSQTFGAAADNDAFSLAPGERPWMVGRAAGDAFVVTLGGAVVVSGFATLGAEQGAGPAA